jgi:hypothetical protein
MPDATPPLVNLSDPVPDDPDFDRELDGYIAEVCDEAVVQACEKIRAFRPDVRVNEALLVSHVVMEGNPYRYGGKFSRVGIPVDEDAMPDAETLGREGEKREFFLLQMALDSLQVVQETKARVRRVIASLATDDDPDFKDAA